MSINPQHEYYPMAETKRDIFTPVLKGEPGDPLWENPFESIQSLRDGVYRPADRLLALIEKPIAQLGLAGLIVGLIPLERSYVPNKENWSYVSYFLVSVVLSGLIFNICVIVQLVSQDRGNTRIDKARIDALR